MLNLFKSKKKYRPWYENALIYEIYPWSFKDANGDGVGDLQGIIDKLDYLNDNTKDSLHVDAIWLCPIFTSPMRDLGYDISDFYSVDKVFGDIATLEKLIAEAHKRNIKVLLDLVSNHTSSDHPWFQESRSSKHNPKRNWYTWRDPKLNGAPPNNWVAVSGGPAWTYDDNTKQYYLHNFLKEQPDLNWRNPEVVKEMKKVVDFWLTKGIDGFRVDAIAHIVEDLQLRDDPQNTDPTKKIGLYDALVHSNSTNQPELRMIIDLLCEKVGEYGEKFIVSEAYVGKEQILDMYEACENGLLAPFNFTLINTPWDAATFKDAIDTFDRAIKYPHVPTYVFGNHDLSRVASRLGKDKARIIAVLLLTLRGTVFLYYGDELGMTDGNIPPEKRKDGFSEVNIASFATATSRDPARTPMLWNASKNAGFTESDDPWLPVSPDYIKNNVEAQAVQPTSFLNLYRALSKLRKQYDAMRYGTYIALSAVSPDVLKYERTDTVDRFMILINFSDREVREPEVFGTLVLSSHMDRKEEKVDGTITLRPLEGCIIKLH